MILKYTVLIYFFINLTFSAKLKPDVRIIGGDEVKNRSQFAYQVLLRFQGAPYCGGSIIDERHVLTAAHCCFNQGQVKMSSSDVTVVVGNLDTDDTSVVKNVQYIFTHEDYDSTLLQDDIAVLRISGTFGNWTDKIQPINLRNSSVPDGEKCTVSGWGTRNWIVGQMTKRLQYVQVPIVNWALCNQQYSRYGGGSIGENVICAGERGKDSCQGDSGGPLVCFNNTLSGIVSYGVQACGSSYPGVYTEVSKYTEWIEKQKLRSSAGSYGISYLSLLFIVYNSCKNIFDL